MLLNPIPLQIGLTDSALMQLIPYTELPNQGKGVFRTAYLLSTTVGSPLALKDETPFTPGSDRHFAGAAFVLIPLTGTIFALTPCCWKSPVDETFCCVVSERLLGKHMADLPATGPATASWHAPNTQWNRHLIPTWIEFLETHPLKVQLYLESLETLTAEIFKKN